MGKASRRKQERREGYSAPPRTPRVPPSALTSGHTGESPLLLTMTNEPFQPVRLYWSIPAREAVDRIFAGLECMEHDEDEDCWVWMFDAESRKLRIGEGYSAVPSEARPIVLGRFRFAGDRTMSLSVNSIERALAAQKFFTDRLGPGCPLKSCRVVNRLFQPEEAMRAGNPAELLKVLDRDVTPAILTGAEQRFLKAVKRVKEAAGGEGVSLDEILGNLDATLDVPPVEELTVDPGEPSALKTRLILRAVRAAEHRLGHDLSLAHLFVHAGMMEGRTA